MLVLCACSAVKEEGEEIIFVEPSPTIAPTPIPTPTPEPTPEPIIPGFTAYEGEGSIKDYLFTDNFEIIYSPDEETDYNYTFSYGYAKKEALSEEVIAQWQEYFQENNNLYSTIIYADDLKHGSMLTKNHLIEDICLDYDYLDFDMDAFQYDGTGDIKDKVYTNIDFTSGEICAFVSVPYRIYNDDIYQKWKAFYQEGEFDYYILLFPDLKLSDDMLNEYGLMGNGFVHYHGVYFDGIEEINPGFVSSPFGYTYDVEKVYASMNIEQDPPSEEEYLIEKGLITVNNYTNSNSGASYSNGNPYNLDTSDWRIQLALSYENTYQGLCTFFATIYAMDIGLGPGFGTRISESELSLGDVILYFDANENYMHIATYLGNGYALHGNYTNDGRVKIAPVHIGYAQEVYCRRGDSFYVPFPSGENGFMDGNAIDAYYAYLNYYGQ